MSDKYRIIQEAPNKFSIQKLYFQYPTHYWKGGIFVGRWETEYFDFWGECDQDGCVSKESYKIYKTRAAAEKAVKRFQEFDGPKVVGEYE